MATTTYQLRLLSSAFSIPLRSATSRHICFRQVVVKEICPLTRKYSVARRCIADFNTIYNTKKSTAKTVQPKLVQLRRQSTISTPAINLSHTSDFGKQNGQDIIVEPNVESNHDGDSATRSGFFPKTTEKSVAYWLFGTAGLVFGIVILGGLTRLTESGLSITEWKPVTGVLPPTNAAAWEVEFDKYKDSPEYRLLNPSMTLSQYKFIYYMEWSHRIMGRLIGISFILPAVYFVSRRKVSAGMTAALAGIGLGIGFQGFIGWWMVKSGLQDDLFQKPGAVPRVSQYRLTAHLGTAFAVYSAMLYSGLAILKSNRTQQIVMENISKLKKLRVATGALTGLVFVTALTGGLVAGLDAGLIYNEFPYMGNNLTPPIKELFDPFYSHTPSPHPDLYYRNMLENPSTVQLQHRILATTTFFSVLALYAYSRRLRSRNLLTVPMRKGVHGVLGAVSLQVALGITTLLYLVPTPLAAAHQANSLVLLTTCLILCSRVFLPRGMGRMVKMNGLGLRAAGTRSAVVHST